VPRSFPIDDDSPELPKPPSSERLLMEHFPFEISGRILCTSLGRGQLAAHLAASGAESVTCWFLDLYAADETRDWQEFVDDGASRPEIVCQSDSPDGPFDLVVLPSSHRGEAERTREQLQQACQRLRDGGMLVCGVDNPEDRWLHAELKKLFPKVRRDPEHHGVVYSAVRQGPPKRIRDFRAEFAFRDQGNLIRAVTRPGVFSHRELDLGARALLEATEIEAGQKVLDIGCGSGSVGLALAKRAAGISLHGLDSNVRAVDCLIEGGRLNDLSNVTAKLTATGEIDEPGTFDLAVGNPPYHSQFRIAEIFVQAARRALKPGGRVVMVTRKPEWFDARLGQLFDDVEIGEVRKYSVVRATQRG
jgi:16S rRNA (guanine1207-N2)-methyltransferase